MDIPGLSTLYAIYKRDIDVTNDTLQRRQDCAKDLYANCQAWSRILVETFNTAVERWEKEGQAAAEHEIMQQEMDFLKLEYWNLEESSPILQFLRKDKRFLPFVASCSEFYTSALSVKRLAYGQIEDNSGQIISTHDAGIRRMVAAWHGEVERMLRKVNHEYQAVRILTQK